MDGDDPRGNPPGVNDFYRWTVGGDGDDDDQADDRICPERKADPGWCWCHDQQVCPVEAWPPSGPDGELVW